MSNEYPYASMRDNFDLSAYFVVGPEDCKGRPLTDVVDQALRGGATFIQLRAKEADASELTDMARDIAQIIEDNEKSDSVAFVIDDRADVVWQARRKGIKAGLCRPKTLWPFPKKELCEATKHASHILDVEMSMGQMIDDVRLATECRLPVSFFGRTGGVIPTPAEVLAEIEQLAGGAE